MRTLGVLRDRVTGQLVDLPLVGGLDLLVVDTLTPAGDRGGKVEFHDAPEDLYGAVQA